MPHPVHERLARVLVARRNHLLAAEQARRDDAAAELARRLDRARLRGRRWDDQLLEWQQLARLRKLDEVARICSGVLIADQTDRGLHLFDADAIGFAIADAVEEGGELVEV